LGTHIRFSEDIDLLVKPKEFDPPLESKNRVNKALKQMRNVVAGHPGLQLLGASSHTTGGLAREDHFEFETRFDQIPGIRSVVMVEAGIRGGPHPTEVMSLRSFAAEYLSSRGLDTLSDDLMPFDMTLLHYRRTYVEKLLALHSKVSTMLSGGKAIDRDARHYADVQLLGQTPAVQAMLRSPEYAVFKADCDKVSRTYFKNYCPPDALTLSDSPALFPDDDLAAVLGEAYDEQCSLLFYGQYPPFDEVLAGFKAVQHLL
jgi:hypothetical protein